MPYPGDIHGNDDVQLPCLRAYMVLWATMGLILVSSMILPDVPLAMVGSVILVTEMAWFAREVRDDE